ncbi:hypothetical protein DYGSA30_08900 [Dyella sp. GSA-30]|nr:hypothetical protein DYGSA30_08900 [Dyella sp. GSA-30]
MLFVGFLFVRKLIECKKVTDSCARSSAKVLRATIRRAREVSDFKRDDLFKDLDSAVWVDTKVDVHQLADKVIHAWWITPIQNEAGGLDGFIFTTDRQRNTELWWLEVNSVVEVYDRFATQVITEIRAARDESGRLTFWQAK